MKKILIILVALFLVSCGGTDVKVSTTELFCNWYVTCDEHATVDEVLCESYSRCNNSFPQ